MELHPQIIGKNEFVVLPFEEYQMLAELAEDYEDLMDLRKSKAEAEFEKPIPLIEAVKQLNL